MPPSDDRSNLAVEVQRLNVSVDQLSRSVDRLEKLTRSLLAAAERAVPSPITLAGFESPGEAVQRLQPLHAVEQKRFTGDDTPSGVLTEDVITFAGAASLIATAPHPATVSRWATQGCRKIKLESAYVGGRRVTSKQAVARFLVACRANQWAGMASPHVLERAVTKD